MALLFAAFMGLCGLTHVVSIVVLWIPLYNVEGSLKAATAVVSIATATLLIALVPKAFDAARGALASKVARTEGALRDSEGHRQQSAALLETVIETVPGMIYAKDRSGRFLLANKAVLDLFGMPWAAVRGKTDGDLLDDRQQSGLIMATDRIVMETGQIGEVEEIATYKDRGKRVWLSTKVPLRDDAQVTGIVGVSIDITERKQLAKELLHISRRSAMGEMATAIAHEINQPLAAVSMYLGGSMTLLETARYEGPVLQSLSQAKVQCQRAGDILRRLRSFVSGGEDVKSPENMTALVNEACGLALLGSRERGVATRITHDQAEIEVLVDRVQIEQVIVNLVRNAMDSMNATASPTLHVSATAGPDGMAIVTVSDNGPGIDAGVSSRLFEPFVSTKGVRGMGVGLSICRTIVEGHGGKIWVDPDAGTGATFHFTVPLCGQAPGEGGEACRRLA